LIQQLLFHPFILDASFRSILAALVYISSSFRADDEHGPGHEHVQERESRHPESYKLLPILTTHHASQKILPHRHQRLTDAPSYVQITAEELQFRENSPLREQDQWHQYLENNIPAHVIQGAQVNQFFLDALLGQQQSSSPAAA
jgi:hypothetical protein